MPTVTSLARLENMAAYQPEGFQDAVSALKRYLAKFEIDLDTTSIGSLTNTAQNVSAGATNLYLVYVKSPAGASNAAYVQLFNVAAASVTLGTTNPVGIIVAPSTRGVAHVFFGGNDANSLFSTRLSVAASGADRSTVLATADLPDVWIASTAN